MNKNARALVLAVCFALSACELASRLASQTSAVTQTPPPAYTAPAPGTPPVEDTPAQREALAKWKARAEEAVAADRKAYNSGVTPTYNFHYGPKNPFTPGNVQAQGEGFFSRVRIPARNIAGHATRRRIASGGRRCTRMPFVHRFIGRA
jgi:hypothetical protein